MKLINLIYDYECDEDDDTIIWTDDDVDIINVPDYVCDNLQSIVQEFENWTSSTTEHGYFAKDGRGNLVLATGTKEFVEWLNNNYSHYENQEIVVVEEHTKYHPEYPSALF